MSTELFLAFHSREDLRAFLDRNRSGDTLLLPRPEGDGSPTQFAPLTLHVSLPGQQLNQDGQVLQLLPDGQLVVGLAEPAVLVPALAEVPAADAAAPPLVSWTEVAIEATVADPPPTPDGRPATTTAPEYWPLEQLQMEWNNLTIAQRISVARRGKLGARRMILKGQEHKLHQYILTNPHITSGEVAALASMTSLAPDLLKRLATQPEWLRHGQVVRNLVCNPKLPLDVVNRLIHKMPDRELRQLSRSGRVRQAVKRMIIKKISGP